MVLSNPTSSSINRTTSKIALRRRAGLTLSSNPVIKFLYALGLVKYFDIPLASNTVPRALIGFAIPIPNVNAPARIDIKLVGSVIPATK